MQNNYDKFLRFCESAFNTLPFINSIRCNNDDNEMWYIELSESYKDGGTIDAPGYWLSSDFIEVFAWGGGAAFYCIDDDSFYDSSYRGHSIEDKLQAMPDIEEMRSKCRKIGKLCQRFNPDQFEYFVQSLDDGLFITVDNGELVVDYTEYI